MLSTVQPIVQRFAANWKEVLVSGLGVSFMSIRQFVAGSDPEVRTVECSMRLVSGLRVSFRVKARRRLCGHNKQCRVRQVRQGIACVDQM